MNRSSLRCRLFCALLFAVLAASPWPGKAEDGGEVRDIRFVAYNLKNYQVGADAPPKFGEGGVRVPGEGKPESDIEALIEVIAGQRPDILGVCELGGEESLRDLKRRLREKGVNLHYHEFVAGPDEARHLALLSRFPIKARASQPNLTYRIGSREFSMRRGILDATIALAPGFDVRFIGVHLKSRRDLGEADQRLMRRNEAYLIRRHADRILAAEPDARLLVYGDFNDTRDQAPIKAVKGNVEKPTFLAGVPLVDRFGARWTYYWEEADTYARYDFILASQTLLPAIDKNPSRSYVASPGGWKKASDHRPLVVTIEAGEGR
ncbi:MAG: hypothetical protein R3F11_04910 [Verrucomicrobiales bacterium]